MGYMLSTKTDYPEGVDARDAAIDADALFVPKTTGTILPNGTVDEKSFTVYREYADGAQAVLKAGAGANFYTGSYASILNTAEAMFPNSVTSMKTWHHGSILVFTQDIDEPYTFADGDSITRSIMYTASMNSVFATRAIGFSFRPFCTNQEGQGELQMSQKRSKNHDEMLFSKAGIMAEAANRFDSFINDAKMLKGLVLTNSLRTRILDTVAPLITLPDANTKAVNHAENRRDGIMYFYGEESDKFGENAFSLYQAVQSYEYHTGTKGKNKEMKQTKVVTDPAEAQSLTCLTRGMLLASV